MKRGLIYATIGLVIAVFLYALLHRHDSKVDQSIDAPVLATDDKLKYVIDQKRHTLTAVTLQNGATKVSRTFLNPHGPVAITEKKDGAVSLEQRTYGTIHEPFIGASFGSDFKFRAAIGVDLFYVQRFELGGGLLLTPTDLRDVRGFAHVAYNVYGDCLLSVGVDNKKAIHLLISARF